MTVIDLATKKAVESFAIPLRSANRLKFTPDDRYVLISALGSGRNSLIVVDARSHSVVKTLDVGGGAAGIQMAPDGTRAYVAVTMADKVAVIDLKSLEVTAQIAPLRQPDGLAWAKDR